MLSKLMQTPIYRNAGMSVETAMPPHWWINKRHDFDLNLLALSGGQHPTRWNKHHSLLGWFPLLTPCSSASPLDTALKTMIDIYWVICLIAGENCALFWYFSEILLSPPPHPHSLQLTDTNGVMGLSIVLRKMRGEGKREQERQKISSYTNILRTTTLSKKWGLVAECSFRSACQGVAESGY